MSNLIKYQLVFLLFTTILSAIPTDTTVTPKITIAQELRNAFLKEPSKLLKNIPQKKFLTSLYRKNNYEPLWVENNELNQSKYQILFKHIEKDLTLDKKGLIYKNYTTLHKNFEQNLTRSEYLRLDLKLSSLYYNFLLHTIYGEIQWKNFHHKLKSLKRKRINAAWVKSEPKFNLKKLMLRPNIDETIDTVTPKNFSYNQLIKALKILEEQKSNGEWEELPYFKKLELGSTGDIVLKLRERLKASGDYVECNETNISSLVDVSDHNKSINFNREAVFGFCLDASIKNFQKRHSLVVDGIVGGGTRRALNMSIDEKIDKVLLNIDRIKWLPRESYERYVIVNIPEFMLHYFENGENKQTLPVIVGDPKHPTPIFSQKISYIVLNPYWKVPEGIVQREIVPAMVKNPNYLRKEGLEAHETWDENSPKVDTSWLYWEEYLYGQKKFPYRIMQPPGPKNALGKIKFKFPNKFSVYLHDTPTKYLFNRRVRAFSHGCIRLSQPQKFLQTISTFNPNINMKKAKKTLKGKRKKFFKVNNQLRIYLVYLTVGMNEDGQIEFRNDIYNYDKYQKRRLR
jgi:murein L,D-transpeptidase YcbB/YkuD